MSRKLKKEFASIASLNVNIGGTNRNVGKAELERESEKFIQLGYGHYFDIPQKEALSISKKYHNKIKRSKLEADKLLEAQNVTLEKQASALTSMSKKVKETQSGLKKAKELMDQQQIENAEVIQEKEKLSGENDALKAKLAELQKQLSGN